jgi:DNA-binding CsgD family transcriptional regulator/tetratricopeptide (TPR) repeat protein
MFYHDYSVVRTSSMIPSRTSLLERDSAIAELHTAAQNVRLSGGRTVVICGEAGIGKTSLLRAWAETTPSNSLVFRWGGCEALFTPRPLGPVFDLAAQLDHNVRVAVRDHKSSSDVFSAFANWLADHTFHQSARLNESALEVLIVEDVHWADYLTLDFLKFISRRVQRSNVLLVLTFRDDEVDAMHPLTQVLGEVPATHCTTIKLKPLSKVSLASLSGYDANRLRELVDVSGGNPFFVTELIAAQIANNGQQSESTSALKLSMPMSTMAAVMARVQRVSASAREVLEVASLVPGSVEMPLLNSLLNEPSNPSIEECVQRGLLNWAGRGLAFRHELARLALEEQLQPAKRKAMHSRLLNALAELEPSAIDRLAYHAARAEDFDALIELAPKAALRAKALGGHREAEAHYRVALEVLECGDRVTTDGSSTAPKQRSIQKIDRAKLLQAWVAECQVLGRVDSKVETAIRNAVQLRRELNEPIQLGKALMELSEVLSVLNQREASAAALDDAQFVLEQAPPNAELARVYSQRSAIHMLQNKWELAERWGRRAIALARQFNAFQIEAHALNSIGSAMLDAAQDRGYNLLMQSLQIALRNELRSDAARAYLNFSEACIRNRDLARAQPMLNEGLKFVQNYDLDKYYAVLLSMQSNVHQMHGRLDEALQVAKNALINSALATPLRNGPNTVLGTIFLQQDLAKGRDLLQQVWRNVLPNAQPDFVAPAAIGIAEGAWLAGDSEACLDVVNQTMSVCRELTAWDFGELAVWFHRAGGDPSQFGARNIAPPCLNEIQGRLEEAASQWRDMGMPRHEAYVLMRMDPQLHPEALNLAIERLDSIGAFGSAALARKLARQHSRAGVKGIKVGPHAAARKNPFGLTPRELEIATLIIDGYSNQRIAERFSRSTRTVEHQVSALLGKLGLTQRTAIALLPSLQRWLNENRALEK